MKWKMIKRKHTNKEIIQMAKQNEIKIKREENGIVHVFYLVKSAINAMKIEIDGTVTSVRTNAPCLKFLA